MQNISAVTSEQFMDTLNLINLGYLGTVVFVKLIEPDQWGVIDPQQRLFMHPF